MFSFSVKSRFSDIPLNQNLTSGQLQEFCFVHLFVCQVFSVVKQRVGRDRCRRILRIFFSLYMDRLESNTMFFCGLFNNGYVFCVERALTRIEKNVAGFINVRMPCAFFEFRDYLFGRERQIPELYPIIRFVTYRKTLMR